MTIWDKKRVSSSQIALDDNNLRLDLIYYIQSTKLNLLKWQQSTSQVVTQVLGI